MITPDQLAEIKARRKGEYRSTLSATQRSTLLVDRAFSDIDILIAEVDRLQLIEKAAEQLDVLREINDYIGHYGEQFVLTGNPKDLK